MSDRVYVNQTGERIWSPNTKEDLCRAVQSLTAEVERLRKQAAELAWYGMNHRCEQDGAP